MYKHNFLRLKIMTLSLCLGAVSHNVTAHNKVVVIPMAGDNTIVEVEPTYKYIFVTSTQTRGNLNGVLGADALCQSDADSAGSLVQGRKFKAWVSDPDKNNINKIGNGGRFMARFDLPYILVDGSLVANTFPDLLDKSIENIINVDQTGTVYGPEGIWTGVLDNGNYSATRNCGGWISDDSADFGLTGVTSQTGVGWSGDTSTFSCNGFARLFCFEQ